MFPNCVYMYFPFFYRFPVPVNTQALGWSIYYRPGVGGPRVGVASACTFQQPDTAIRYRFKISLFFVFFFTSKRACYTR